jgi:hypothetical protein
MVTQDAILRRQGLIVQPLPLALLEQAVDAGIPVQ